MYKKEAWIMVAWGLFPIVIGLLSAVAFWVYGLFACL